MPKAYWHDHVRTAGTVEWRGSLERVPPNRKSSQGHRIRHGSEAIDFHPGQVSEPASPYNHIVHPWVSYSPPLGLLQPGPEPSRSRHRTALGQLHLTGVEWR